MKKSLMLLPIILFASLTVTIAEPEKQSPEVKVLNRWLGSWKSEVVIKPSIWMSEGKRSTETNEVQWVFDRRMHVLMIKNQNDEQENLAIQRYNAKIKKYEMWILGPDDSSYYLGSWNEEAATMTWKYVDFGSGISGTIVDRFTPQGTWQQTFLMKDRNGNALLDIEVERTPVSGTKTIG